MASIKVFIACLFTTIPLGNSDLISPLDQLTWEAADVIQPAEETIANDASSQCSKIKQLLGLSYEQTEGPNVNDLTFKYIGDNGTIAYNINEAAEQIPQAPWFNPNLKLYVYVSGFNDFAEGPVFRTIRDALFKAGECNVLVLDCGWLIQWMYLRSSTNARFIGEKLGEVLAAITKNGVNPSKIHIIGASLGGHIVGFAGKQFTRARSSKLGRISGLDPALPCFSDVDDDLRLEETDAEFVDVIHTNAGVFGMVDPLGHVDYYPNGGHHQPGCLETLCSHNRVIDLYAESVVSPQAFPAVKCDSWDAFKAGKCFDENISYMGHPSTSKASGKYYLLTAGYSPYGLRFDGIKSKHDEGVIKNTAAGTHSWCNKLWSSKIRRAFMVVGQ